MGIAHAPGPPMELGRVNDIWYLAAEDFAAASDYTLPPRRVFLGALQRQPGIAVVYDRRVFTRDGRLKGKTTFYRLPSLRQGHAEANAVETMVGTTELRRAA